MILIYHLCILNTKSVVKFRKYPLNRQGILSEYKIALLKQKWPDHHRYGWPDVGRFYWPDANARGGRFGAFFAQEVEKVFRLACFNLFSHNRNDHAKNFSYIMDEKGVWSFSPVYDITFSNGAGGEHSMMYLGEGKNPTKENLLQLAKKHGIKNGAFIIDEVKGVIEQWIKFANIAGVSEETKRMISTYLRER